MVAKVLGGSLASIPSNALDKEIIRRSTNELAPLTSARFTERSLRLAINSDRPANATDATALFN